MDEKSMNFIERIDIWKFGERITGLFKNPSETIAEIKKTKPIEQTISIISILMFFELMLGLLNPAKQFYSYLFDYPSTVVILVFIGIFYLYINPVKGREDFVSTLCVLTFAIIPFKVSLLLLEVVALAVPLTIENVEIGIFIIYAPTFLISLSGIIYSGILVLKSIKALRGIPEYKGGGLTHDKKHTNP